MKAIVRSKYGSPDVLELREIEKPAVEDDHVLVRVHAASVNAGDWHSMRGKPYIIRLMLGGLFKPRTKNAVLGGDLAGRVEAVGGNVTEFQPGDEVFGMSIRTFAEYVSVRRVGIVRKPANLTFEQAAAVPVAAITALQGLRDKGHIRPGQKVLINGASGGVGTFAVHIAKSFGADVTGVCSTRNVDMVRSIGADRVIDYTQEDFTKSGQRYDLLFDCIGNHSFSACRRVLNPKGIYIPVGGPSGRWKIGLARGIKRLVLSRFVSQNLVAFFLAKPSQGDLTIMHDLMKAGKVTPVIDKRYSLSEAPHAIRYQEEGHARGKVVITLE